MVNGFDGLAAETGTKAAAQKAAEHVDPYYHVQPQSAMPNPFKFAVNAGDVCLFDTTYVIVILSSALLQWQQHATTCTPWICYLQVVIVYAKLIVALRSYSFWLLAHGFCTSIWHTASPNTSGRDRENTIVHYQANSRPATPAVPLDVLRLAESAGLLSHERKKLLAYDR